MNTRAMFDRILSFYMFIIKIRDLSYSVCQPTYKIAKALNNFVINDVRYAIAYAGCVCMRV